MNELNKIKYVYLDLDWTTLTSKDQISDKTFQALKILRKNNIEIGIATGRGTFLCSWIVEAIKPELPFVGLNGLIAYDFVKEKTLYEKKLDNEISQKLINYFYEINITFFVYDKTKILYYKYKDKSGEWMKMRSAQNLKQEKKHQYETKEIKQTDFAKQQELYKIIIFTEDLTKEELDKIKSKVEEFPSVYWLMSHDFLIEIMPKGESKGDCLKALEKQGIINLENTLAFGDSNNDVEMFEVVKYAVAMENATPTIKGLATHHTLSNDDEGIYHFVTNIWKLS